MLWAIYWITYSEGPCLSNLLLHDVPPQDLAALTSSDLLFVLIPGVGWTWPGSSVPHGFICSKSYGYIYLEAQLGLKCLWWPLPLTLWPLSGLAWTSQMMGLGSQERKSRGFSPVKAEAQSWQCQFYSLPLIKASRMPVQVQGKQKCSPAPDGACSMHA